MATNIYVAKWLRKYLSNFFLRIEIFFTTFDEGSRSTTFYNSIRRCAKPGSLSPWCFQMESRCNMLIILYWRRMQTMVALQTLYYHYRFGVIQYEYHDRTVMKLIPED